MSLKDFWNNGIDFEKIGEHYKIIFFLVLAITAILLFKKDIVENLNLYEQNKEWCKRDFEKEFSGTIVKKGKDRRNHGFLYFQLKDSTKIFDDMVKVHPKVSVGDSVVKKKNSMLLFIYKPDTIITIHYHTIFKYRDSLMRRGNY